MAGQLFVQQIFQTCPLILAVHDLAAPREVLALKCLGHLRSSPARRLVHLTAYRWRRNSLNTLPSGLIAAIACFPHFVAGLTFNRIEGVLFFISYAGYTTWLVLQATGSLMRPDYERVVMTIVLPILVPVVLLVLWSKYRLSRSAPKKAKSS